MSRYQNPVDFVSSVMRGNPPKKSRAQSAYANRWWKSYGKHFNRAKRRPGQHYWPDDPATIAKREAELEVGPQP